jgi:hypothetical protein
MNFFLKRSAYLRKSKKSIFYRRARSSSTTLDIFQMTIIIVVSIRIYTENSLVERDVEYQQRWYKVLPEETTRHH